VTDEFRKTLLAWSSGKDSAYALQALRPNPSTEVVGMLTTVNSAVARVSMHGVRESLLDAQAEACGLPLTKVWLPDPCSDDEYRHAMAEAISELTARGVESIAFGDLFLEEVRSYREAQLEAIITCVDTEQIDRGFLGRRYDKRLLEELPSSVDPCGENGEFHTVAVAGRMFDERLDVRMGPTVDKGRFVFVDVELVNG
jgi:diphthamide synthase (EF-2-diphthine--ammonia ligase)